MFDRTTLALTTAAILAATTISLRPARADVSCASFGALAAQSLPAQVGSPGLVSAMLAGAAGWTTNPLSARFNYRAAGAAAGDRFRPSRICPAASVRRRAPGQFVCEYANPADPRSSLDVEMPLGRVTYINAGRRFDPAGPDNAVTPAEALETARAMIEGLGVPPGEIDLAHAQTSARLLLSGPRDRSRPTDVRRMEVLATFTRAVNGFPVLDSKANVAIDAAGRPVRAHVVWPDFTLGGGLADATATSRNEVISQIVETMGSFAGSCNGFDRMLVQVGWIAAQARDGSDEHGAATPPGRYVPGLRVIVAPPEGTEDSGQFDDFVHSFTVPLVAGTGETI